MWIQGLSDEPRGDLDKAMSSSQHMKSIETQESRRHKHAGTLLDLRGAACPAIVQLLKHYCEHLSCTVSLLLEAESLVDMCSSEYNNLLG